MGGFSSTDARPAPRSLPSEFRAGHGAAEFRARRYGTAPSPSVHMACAVPPRRVARRAAGVGHLDPLAAAQHVGDGHDPARRDHRARRDLGRAARPGHPYGDHGGVRGPPPIAVAASSTATASATTTGLTLERDNGNLELERDNASSVSCAHR